MNVLFVLIPASLFLSGLGLCAFLWTVKNMQYDDTEGSSARILLDEEDLQHGNADDTGR
ncbi:cbb3-type cytochrome oxidase assembly protein CcoS [uncultured Litoreibacter sp.]|uniref:cbb3-type cytochrome oxidase assembly protein CcoS n=1 Tax=uncultured Litoreibacter sp. TaxID=1392394 RepID=UPI00260C02D3|nr:cbb3-type cytochrome oxidase assembly protein CcoS [uncultured Litoreibacter sp.]